MPPPSICCLSISHRKAPVRVLESFSFNNVDAALLDLKTKGAEECVIVQTCHRVEIYALGSGVTQ